MYNCINFFPFRWAHLDVNYYCADYHRTQYWRAQYECPIRPLGPPADWDIPEDVRSLVIVPPIWRGQAGRPRKNRIPSAGDGTRARKCSLCKKPGHYRSHCRELTPSADSSSAPQQSTSRTIRKCSICRKPGHNSATCIDNIM